MLHLLFRGRLPALLLLLERLLFHLLLILMLQLLLRHGLSGSSTVVDAPTAGEAVVSSVDYPQVTVVA
jgi:hypothetical protein